MSCMSKVEVIVKNFLTCHCVGIITNFTVDKVIIMLRMITFEHVKSAIDRNEDRTQKVQVKTYRLMKYTGIKVSEFEKRACCEDICRQCIVKMTTGIIKSI